MKNHDPNELSRKDILKGIYKESRAAASLTMGTIGILEIVMIVFSFINTEIYEDKLLTYRVCYFLLLGAVILFFLLNYHIGQDYDHRYRFLRIIHPVYAFFLYGWALAITYFDLMKSGELDPTLFMTFSLTLPICLFVPIPLYNAIAILADIAMLYLSTWGGNPLGPTINLLIFFIFQLVVGNILIKYRESLAERILKTEAQKIQIDEMSASQRSFFSSISHEIRNPINTIIGLDEMILRENISEEVNENARYIRSAGKMLLSLLNDILDMSKSTAGMTHLVETSYKTTDLFLDLWGMLKIRAEQKNLEFDITPDPLIPSGLLGDEVRIKQILINLLGNAIKYTKIGSVRMKVSCKEDGEDSVLLKFVISDTGIGIREEYLPKLFTAYNRLGEEEIRSIEGTGLGLSIVKQLTDLMGGDVEVSSVYGEGSTFTVTIPQKVIDRTPIGAIDLAALKEADDPGVYHGRIQAPNAKVLLVDDTPANLFVIKKLLGLSRVIVDTAESGADALVKTACSHYNVIFLDHLMPGMDGIETFHAIRTQTGGRCKDSRVVMLTANASPENEALYREEGFDGYLPKPVSSGALEDELIRLLPEELKQKPKDADVSAAPAAEASEEVDPELKQIFLSSIDKTAGALEEYLEATDLKNYTIQVHGLKSSAALVKRSSLSAKAKALEEAAKNGDLDKVKELHPDLIREYTSLKTGF